MDEVQEIKIRLPIDQLVGQYCQIQKKGRNFMCICPFHNDSHPSMVVSPDKGIAYCFACNSGGDIFSFYQKIENVDFPQAVKDLADKVGIEVKTNAPKGPKKEEKDRLRECLDSANAFYVKQLSGSDSTKKYLESRGITTEEKELFALGMAPSDKHATYNHLLKQGFSKSEIVKSGLGIQRDLNDEKVIDRFRSRLMFPIHDHQGNAIGFGGRTLSNDDAKYVNSAETALYHKSTVLYGIHLARDTMRSEKCVIVVEGYFDVIAFHKVGAKNVVATCGTSLTEDHARLLKRQVETVILCLDQDNAGRAAAERAFATLSQHEINVEVLPLGSKDPADAAQENPEELKNMLEQNRVPYLDWVLTELRTLDYTQASSKRDAFKRLLPLINLLSTRVEQSHYITEAASMMGVPESAIADDLAALNNAKPVLTTPQVQKKEKSTQLHPYSSMEITLGFFLLYPELSSLMSELIAPKEGFTAHLYEAITAAVANGEWTVDSIELSKEDREKVDILLLYCEEQGLSGLSEKSATREIQKNCRHANKEMMQQKVKDLAQKIRNATVNGQESEKQLLQNELNTLLRLVQKAS